MLLLVSQLVLLLDSSVKHWLSHLRVLIVILQELLET